jgi:hypothetical protein
MGTIGGKRALGALLVAVLCAVAVACGSDSDTSSPTTNDAAANGSCPFSGSTDAQSVAGARTATSISAVTPSTSGCSDNVVFKFSPTVAAAQIAYQTATADTGAQVLGVTFDSTSLGGTLKTGTTTNPKGLNHVSKVVVSSSGGKVVIAITLDAKRPFLVSSSQVPAQLELSIG